MSAFNSFLPHKGALEWYLCDRAALGRGLSLPIEADSGSVTQLAACEAGDPGPVAHDPDSFNGNFRCPRAQLGLGPVKQFPDIEIPECVEESLNVGDSEGGSSLGVCQVPDFLGQAVENQFLQLDRAAKSCVCLCALVESQRCHGPYL